MRAYPRNACGCATGGPRSAAWRRALLGFGLLLAAAGQSSAADDPIIDGNDLSNRIVVQLTAGDPTRIQVTVDGDVALTAATADLSSITLNGLLGDDTFVVDYGNGFFTIVTAVNGGGEISPRGDVLVIEGKVSGGDTEASYLVGAVAGDGKSGTITHRVGGASHEIRFTGLEPIETLSVSSSLTINVTASGDTINFVPGPPSTGVDPVTGLSGEPTYQVNFAGAFELINFRNAASLTINAFAGADIITLDQPSQLGDSLASVTVNAGDGADVVNLRVNPAAIASTVNGDADNDAINIGSASNVLSGVLGAVTVDGGSHAVAPTVTGTVTANGQTVSVTLPVGDTLNLNDQSYGSAAQYNLYGASFDRDTTVAVTTYSNFETVNLNGASAANDVNVVATPASVTVTATGQDSADDVDVTVTGAGALVVVNGVGGADSVDLAATGAASVTLVNGGADGDTVALTVSGANSGVALNGEAGADTTTIANTGTGGSTLASGGSEADQITVQGAGASSRVQLDGDAGADTLRVQASAAGSQSLVNGGDDYDTIEVGNGSLDGVLGAVTVNGGGGADILGFDDSADASSNSYDVLNASLDRAGSPALLYSAVETLTLDSGSGQDDVLVNLESPPSDVQTFQLDTGDEAGPTGDTVTAIGTSTVDLQLLGGNPTDPPGDTLIYSPPVSFFDEFETLDSPQLVVFPADIRFPDLDLAGAVACETVDVTNLGALPLEWSASGCDASPFELVPVGPGGTIDPDASQSFDVCVDPTAVAGPGEYTCTVIITSNDPDLPDFEVPVRAKIGFLPVPMLGPVGALLLVLMICGAAVMVLRR